MALHPDLARITDAIIRRSATTAAALTSIA